LGKVTSLNIIMAHRPIYYVNCPLCNTPRQPRLTTVGNSGKTLCQSPTCIREVLNTATVIPSIIKKNSLYFETYKEAFRSIGQGLVVLGSIQAVFNVRLVTVNPDINTASLIAILKSIHQNQVFAYKVGISLGSLLIDTENEVERVMYFHASVNNASVFYDIDSNPNPYILIKNNSDFEICLETLQEGFKNTINRPDTKWQLLANVNANISLIRSSGGNVLLGRLDSIPPLYRQRGMLHFNRDPVTKRVIRDYLCFFRCLAQYLYNTTEATLTLFKLAYPNVDVSTFKGIQLTDLDRLETVFKVKIKVFSLQSGKKSYVKVIRSTVCGQENTLNLNLYRNHLSLIIDFKKYGLLYSCTKCHHVFSSQYNLKRHTSIKKDCTQVKFNYKGGVYKPGKTVFQKLAELNIQVPSYMQIYPYKIVFDFESYFVKPTATVSAGKNTQIECHHVPLSASVACDYPGYTEPVCFVREIKQGDSALVERVLKYIDELGCLINTHVRGQFSSVIQTLDALIVENVKLEINALEISGLTKANFKSSPVETVKHNLMSYINRVPVIGFNSGRYDLNLIKKEFHAYFSMEKTEIQTIKRCNQYIAVYTENLVFLDMFNYLAPGYSYANYLKAFLKDCEKGFFPYEWMNGLRKLNNTKLPPRQAFYSTLTNTTITQVDYKKCQAIWVAKKMKTMQDYLIYYNNLDVEPFVRAINKHTQFFTERGVDMFKDGLTLPGLTLKFLFNNTNANAMPYVLFSQKEQDIHQLVRKNLVGGPSIVFHRQHCSGVTRIRERLYGSKSRICRHILGVDANSLYLKCMGENHCTGFYVVRRREHKFKPIMSQQTSFMATEWLRYMTIVDKVDILHQYNYGEISVGCKRIKVDGFVTESKCIYQFHGCYWHGHTCHLNKSLLSTEKGREWVKKQCLNTLAVGLYLRALGFTVVEIYECQWLKLQKNTQVLQLKPQWFIPRPSNHSNSSLSEADIIKGITNGDIFGLVQVDIHTPDQLKDMFYEMTPIFKNTVVSKDDVGEHMRAYLEASGKLKQPQRQLIGSFHGTGLLLGTPLLKWYLNKGLIVSKIYLLVEYTPEKTFETFVQEVTSARRKGDENVDCKILSDLYKLLGNSSYGKTICNKQNFLNTKYVSPTKARKLALHWSVQETQDICENTVELSCLPRSITFDLPIQIGYMVYQYAKLKMLAFYYDFLLKFIDRKDFEMCEMDTDSLYFALSTTDLDEAVIPEKREQYFTERHLWLPSESCDIDHHRSTYIHCKTLRLPWLPAPCCKSRLLFDKRTPGLFKIEWEGDAITALNPKCYFGVGVEPKLTCKGVTKKQNNLTVDHFNKVLTSEKTHMVNNRGFKVKDHQVSTYTQKKSGLNYQYLKRQVCEDGVSTMPLDI
jgi:hypothetical protein